MGAKNEECQRHLERFLFLGRGAAVRNLKSFLWMSRWDGGYDNQIVNVPPWNKGSSGSLLAFYRRCRQPLVLRVVAVPEFRYLAAGKESINLSNSNTRRTCLLEVKVAFLLEAFEMSRQLLDLRLQLLNSLWLRRSRPTAYGCPTPRSSNTNDTQPRGITSRCGKWCNRCWWVHLYAFASCDGIIRMSAIVCIPETLHPLQEF